MVVSSSLTWGTIDPMRYNMILWSQIYTLSGLIGSVVELEYTLVLNTNAARIEGSNPSRVT